MRSPIGPPTPFGIEDYEPLLEEAGGAADTQAGSHPFQFTTTLNLKAVLAFDSDIPPAGEEAATPAALAKEVVVKLPPGLIGNPTAYPRCSLAQFDLSVGEGNACPSDTALGVAVVTFQEPRTSSSTYGLQTRALPIFNLEPNPGEPARFGFAPVHVPTFLDTSVRTGEDYGVTVHVDNIPQSIGFLSNTVTFWGVPGSPLHGNARGIGCLDTSEGQEDPAPCEPEGSSESPPFLTTPTSCPGEPLHNTAEASAWEQPGSPLVRSEPDPTEPMSRMGGCGILQFHGEVSAQPDDTTASTPSGLKVNVRVPQEGQTAPGAQAQSNIKNITVTLPAGVTLNPSAADGLQACSGNTGSPLNGEMGVPGDQIGFKGEEEFASEPGVKQLGFTPRMPGSKAAIEAGELTPLAPGNDFCPEAAKIANVKITTPLLPESLKGAVYLASPQNFKIFPPENPFATHVAMYLVAEDPEAGTLVKLPGKVELGGEPGSGAGLAPGQIRSTFADSPQLPFEDAEITFFGGERAPLSTPAHCGVYTTTATFEPWDNTSAHHEVLSSESRFSITSGPNGGPCPGPSLPFSPSLSSETTNINAGSFTPLSTTLSRPTGDQSIQSVTLHYPAGLSGLLSGVELCPEPQANAGTCGPNSQIGETIVSVGVGAEPFTVTGGKVYITGPYDGAPFGLSIVNPAKAGPFDLQEGRPVIVRAKVEIDPYTAALTITTDTSGEHAIPTMIEGFALQIEHVNVLVNRPGFTFNPTSCNPAKVTGKIESAEGASSAVEVPFQVTNCAMLKFTPKFTVSTSGKTSKADGASLTAKLSEPNEPRGSQSNIVKVKVELPLQLPSRLTTLQKACLASVFEANPAACPSASKIGYAKVITPLLPVPLEGPAIFVSHGNEAFPSLTIVLQGYGVTVDLVGSTYISPQGITSTTYKAVPDAPFNTFELTLPEGPYSALAANGDLCKPTKTVTVKKRVEIKVHGRAKTVTRKVKQTEPASLIMPSEFVAQRGGEIFKQNTKIAVTACPKATKASHRKGKKK